MPKKNIMRLCGHGVQLFLHKGLDEQGRMLNADFHGGEIK
jgi:hypothetical protein